MLRLEGAFDRNSGRKGSREGTSASLSILLMISCFSLFAMVNSCSLEKVRSVMNRPGSAHTDFLLTWRTSVKPRRGKRRRIDPHVENSHPTAVKLYSSSTSLHRDFESKVPHRMHVQGVLISARSYPNMRIRVRRDLSRIEETT